MKTLGNLVAEKRKLLGLSQADLAEKLKKLKTGSFSRQWIANLETDRMKRPLNDRKIKAFSEILKISFDELREKPISAITEEESSIDELDISELIQNVAASRKKITLSEFRKLCLAYFHLAKAKETAPTGWKDLLL